MTLKYIFEKHGGYVWTLAFALQRDLKIDFEIIFFEILRCRLNVRSRCFLDENSQKVRSPLISLCNVILRLTLRNFAVQTHRTAWAWLPFRSFLMASLVGCRIRSRTLLRPLTPRRVRVSRAVVYVFIRKYIFIYIYSWWPHWWAAGQGQEHC